MFAILREKVQRHVESKPLGRVFVGLQSEQCDLITEAHLKHFWNVMW